MKNIDHYLMKQDNNFNLIRLIAAFLVIYGHASAITGHGPADLFLQYVGFKFIGGVAVDIFFYISGFLITASALNSKGLKYYIASRVLRIYPALIICIIFMILLGYIFTNDQNYLVNISTWKYFIINASAIDVEYFLPGVFESLQQKGINGSLWSLSVEVKLYIVVLIAAFLKILKNKILFNTIFFFIILIGYFEPNFFLYFLKYDNHVHVSMLFLLGSFTYINRSSLVLNPFILLFLLFLAASNHHNESFNLFYMMLLGYAVLCVAFVVPNIVSKSYGDYSYGVYLYGWPIAQLVNIQFPDLSNNIHSVITCVITLLVAIISWHFIENKALAYKKIFKN